MVDGGWQMADVTHSRNPEGDGAHVYELRICEWPEIFFV